MVLIQEVALEITKSSFVSSNFSNLISFLSYKMSGPDELA